MKNRILILVIVVFLIRYFLNQPLQNLHSIEKRYDADGLLIVVDREHDMFCLYDEDEFIGVIRCDTEIFENGDIPIIVYEGEKR